jgi:hypothetical protein
MVLYQLIWLALGAGLAQRFKFMVLGPAIVIVLFAAVSSGIAQADSLPRTILIAVTGAVSLQVGYFVGLGVRFLSRPKISGAPQSFRPHTPTARHSAS